jgi:hypothetical protein
MDLFGPIGIPSLSRKRYVYVIVDDYIRFIWVIFLATKEEAFENFVIFCTRVENGIIVKKNHFFPIFKPSGRNIWHNIIWLNL